MTGHARPFVCLPAPVLPTLADRCGALGEPGAEALRAAGRVAGARLFEALGPRASRLSVGEFWARVDDRLRELNLGSLRVETLDPGVAAISWYGMPEAGGPEAGPRSSRGCRLATGLLTELLSLAAGRPVAVLEAECGADTPHACRFLVGSEARVAGLRERIASGASVADAVEAT